MKTSKTASPLKAFTIVACVGAALIIGAIGGSSLASATQAPQPQQTYSTNAKSQTFGSAGTAASAATEPDLIQALASNGAEGYAYKKDLDWGTNFASPDAALAWQAANAGKSHTINVYKSDGTTVIGEFTLQASTVNPTNEVLLADTVK